MIRKLWNDDCGAAGLQFIEWIFFFTIVLLGSLVGLVAVRQAIISELTESAQAILSVNQSFSFTGQTNCQSSTAGSSASDFTNTINEGSVGVGPFGAGTINQSPCD